MLRHHPATSLTPALAALSLSLAACNPRQPSSGAVGDSAVGVETVTSSGTANQVGEVRNLEGPESARYDADQDVWFVSNLNGNPAAKDNNGYISRIRSDGTPDSLKFIASGRNAVTLHAPKGMAIVGDTLWVADIDAVRAFNKRTGAPLTSVRVREAKFLNDVAVGPDSALYLTDTGLILDPKTIVKHVGPDRIFRVANGRGTVALESSQLKGLNGIAWEPEDKEFVIVSFMSPAIVAWRPGEKSTRPLGTGPGEHDGVEPLSDGRLLISSWADSSLFVVEDGRPTKVASGISSPADIGISGKRVAVPQLMDGRVQFWELP